MSIGRRPSWWGTVPSTAPDVSPRSQVLGPESRHARSIGGDKQTGTQPPLRPLLAAFQSTGLMMARPLVRALAKDHLTVICYHRVQSSSDNRFQGYKPTISASEETFTRQMDYLRANYDPITLRDLVAWLDRGHPLPPRPALVTFDDGYRDNAEVAWPIMRKRGVPAVIFLATDYIGTGQPFIWDLAAYLFAATSGTRADIPLIGSTNLTTDEDRDAATAAWVDAMKRLPGGKRPGAVRDLSVALEVSPPGPDAFRHLYLDWPDVQDLARNGVEFGGHTCSHPILTGIPVDEARAEIQGSIRRVAEALGSRTLGFAYPNGSSRDYEKAHEEAVEESGVPLAFSLEPGPMLVSEIPRGRMAIRRVYVGAQETMPRFVAKLMGLARISHVLRPSLKIFTTAKDY